MSGSDTAPNASLPPGWALADLNDVGVLHCGQSPPSDTVNDQAEGTPYISGPEQWDGSALRLDRWTTTPKRIVPDGSVFVTVKGAGVGTVFPGVRAAIGRDIYAYMPEPDVSAGFIKHILRFTAAEVVRRAQGDIPGLSKDHILNHRIPLPPSAEQDRIAHALDELFSDLDAGVAALVRARKKLAHYRASVLKAAVEGALTSEWRRQHPQTEPASELLKRILAERRRRWEEGHRCKFKKAGREPAKDWEAKYREPVAPSSGDLSTLPKGWCWATVEQVGSVQLGRQRAPQHHQGLFMRPYLRVANVYEDRIDLSSVLHMNFTPTEFETYQLCNGDVLLNEGQSIELVGRPAIYRGELPGACFQNTLIRFRPFPGVLPEYALTYFRACLRNHRFRKLARWTTNIAHLGADRFAAAEFPMPPIAEQEAIVEAVEDQLSVVDHLEVDLEAKVKSAQGLRHAILYQAFTGRLVPQNPSDEPVSELLKRIAAERETRACDTGTAKRAPVSTGAPRLAVRRPRKK